MASASATTRSFWAAVTQRSLADGATVHPESGPAAKIRSKSLRRRWPSRCFSMRALVTSARSRLPVRHGLDSGDDGLGPSLPGDGQVVGSGTTCLVEPGGFLLAYPHYNAARW